MTPLVKRVQRRCETTKDGGRRLVVALDPGDEIAVRLERGRKWFRVAIIDVYHLAVKREMGLKLKRRGRKS